MRFKPDDILKNVHSWDEFTSAVNSLGNTKSANKKKGDVFERLVQLYFKYCPDYAIQVQDVWLDVEIPYDVKEECNLPPQEKGIDLLIRAKNGEFWSVQAKYRKNISGSMAYEELSTFGMQTGSLRPSLIKKGFICATKIEKTHEFDRADFPYKHILVDEWRSLSDDFWKTVREVASGNEPEPLTPFTPKPHQQPALDAAKKYFLKDKKNKGKLIMACGTGKSLIGFWTAVDVLKAKTIVLGLPSLDLIKQTYTDWAREAYARKINLDVLIVCSDRSTASNDDLPDVESSDLQSDVTLEKTEIKSWLKKKTSKEGIRVVFVTYQSGRTLAGASGTFQFDLGIFDEAHKTAGAEGKPNQHLLYQKNIKIKRRVFMTATERYYNGEKDTIVGMNDSKVYGETYHELKFGKAIKDGILAKYEVVLMQVTTEEAKKYKQLIDERIYVQAKYENLDEVQGLCEPVTADDLASAIALRKAFKEFKLSHGISFHARNSYAKDFSTVQEGLNGTGLSKYIKNFRVSGDMNAKKRADQLDRFAKSKSALITNARCLTEGVDVPAIDLVLFAQPRKSKVDIVQAIGRALRKPNDQPEKVGYVLVPLVLDFDENGLIDIDSIVQGTGYENLILIIRAMAAVDGDVSDRIRVVTKKGRKKRGIGTGGGSAPEDIDPTYIKFDDFTEEIKLRALGAAEGLLKRPLNIELILKWIDDHYKRTGNWPSERSGQIENVLDENWMGVNTALKNGWRGLKEYKSLAQLLHDTGRKLFKEDLVLEQILKSMDYHFNETGEWPNQKSGQLLDNENETWDAIGGALIRSGRGLKVKTTIRQLLHDTGRLLLKEDHSIEKILEWADDHFEKTGKWPNGRSGKLLNNKDEDWESIDKILIVGGRGLSGGSSLAKLLDEHGRKVNLSDQEDLEEEQIIKSAKFHFEKTGKWPNQSSGQLLDNENETWSGIDKRLNDGGRGLSGGSSLSKLLAKHGLKQNNLDLPDLTHDQILDWVDKHYEKYGKWPLKTSGKVIGENFETWISVNEALMGGKRGLPYKKTLARLLHDTGRKIQTRFLEKLTEEKILDWADKHYEKHEEWPNSKSGAVIDLPFEDWRRINSALMDGLRGLEGGSSLAKLLAEKRNVDNATNRTQLTESSVIDLIDAYYEKHKKWPNSKSGQVDGDSELTWGKIDRALQEGYRGLTGGSSLFKFKKKHGRN